MAWTMIAEDWLRPARRRAALIVMLTAPPVVAVVTAAALRWSGPIVAITLGLLTVGVAALIARHHAQRLTHAWLICTWNRLRPDLQDSAELLFSAPAKLGPLQALQRSRLQARIDAVPPPDLRPPLPMRTPALAWVLGLAITVALLVWPTQRSADTLAPSGEEPPTAPGMARLVGQRLRVVPPAYTGLPARDLGELDAKVPQGARLIWTLAFAPEPSSASLAILGGGAIPLVRTGERWGASTMLTASMLYRIAPVSSRRHRIEAIVDQPPVVTVRTPAKTLSIATAGQRGWPLVFEATDDYGVAAQADLTITVAAGEGENVSFREHHLTLRGSGDPRQRRFSTTLDLAALGFSGPGDLVAQLTVRDGRNPGPHIVRSPSLILRRLPPSVSEGTGIDGALRATLPACLRSQRQVIIDTEALLRERGRLSPERFRQRSLAIGEDQAALRLRYGQFLGGEHEMHDTELPTSDPAPTTLGKDDDVLGDFGHKHDEGEAATLFDPETRARLTQAVDQMWQSEGALRGGEPARALPFANRALVLIKQVQQATRVFLAKVGGSELPPIDEARRLTGKRDDIAPVDPGLSALPADAEAAAAWAAIDGTPGMATNLTLLTRWFRANRARVGDPLAWDDALDRLRRDPGCEPCRVRLRGLVWSALPRPPVGAARRDGAGASGARYLDALARGTGR